MLPEFKLDRNLLEGIHRATLREVAERFGTGNARRLWLGRRFEDIVGFARATGKVERIFLWGSFVTHKPEPKDLDVFLIMSSDFDSDSLEGDMTNLFSLKRAQLRFSADVYWMRSSVGEELLQAALETWQYTREFTRRGIVEVIEND